MVSEEEAGKSWTSGDRPNEVTVVRETSGANGGTSRKAKESLIIWGLVNGTGIGVIGLIVIAENGSAAVRMFHVLYFIFW